MRNRSKYKWMLGLAAVIAVAAVVQFQQPDLARCERGLDRRTVVACSDLHPGSLAEASFTVSPDGRWLVYGRATGRTIRFEPEREIVVCDLGSGDESVVDTGEAVAATRGGSREPSAAQRLLAQMMHADWRGDEVRFGSGRATAWVLDAADGHLHRSGPGTAGPHRPSPAAIRAYLHDGHDGINGAAATAWDGTSLGLYIYSGRSEGRGGNQVGLLERRPHGGGEREVLQRHGSLTGQWSVRRPAVSPDGRLVAYVATCQTLFKRVLQMIPPFAMGFIPPDEYLCVHDVQTGRRWRGGRVTRAVGLQWSDDGRSLWFADLDARGEDTIEVIRFPIPPGESDPERVPWSPAQRDPRCVVLSTVQPAVRPVSRGGLVAGHLPGVTFRYPDDRLTVIRQGDQASVHLRDPAGGTDGLLMSFEVVAGRCLDLAPRGASRRSIPGLSLGCVLCRGMTTRQEIEGVPSDRWWIAIDAETTLIVTRPRIATPDRDADRLFAELAESVAITDRPAS